jgi:hypothetical protein
MLKSVRGEAIFGVASYHSRKRSKKLDDQHGSFSIEIERFHVLPEYRERF